MQLNIWLLIMGPLFGVIIILFYRYILGFPFPWEVIPVKLHNPDPAGVKKCFNMLEDGNHLDMVMGEMNSNIVTNKEVIDSLDNALKKDVKIRTIVGPKFDKNSEVFAQHLLKSKKVEFYQLDKRPKVHFRKINDRDLYLEPYHTPLKGSKYWALHYVRGFVRRYKRIFNTYITDAVEIKQLNQLNPRK